MRPLWAPHLARVYQTKRPVDFTVLRGIFQRLMISELDRSITWAEIKRAVRKLANGKNPGLNDPPGRVQGVGRHELAHLVRFLQFLLEQKNGLL